MRKYFHNFICMVLLISLKKLLVNVFAIFSVIIIVHLTKLQRFAMVFLMCQPVFMHYAWCIILFLSFNIKFCFKINCLGFIMNFYTKYIFLQSRFSKYKLDYNITPVNIGLFMIRNIIK